MDVPLSALAIDGRDAGAEQQPAQKQVRQWPPSMGLELGACLM